MPKKSKSNPIFSSKPISSNIGSHDQDIQSSLKTIYRDTAGHSVDVTKLETYRGRGFFHYANKAVIGLIALGVLFIGYTYVRSTFFDSGAEETLVLTWDAPQAVTSGEEVELVLQYENKFDVPLSNVELTLQYPDNFIFTESVPGSSDQDGRIWRITGISAQEKGAITVKGKLYGKIAENGTIQALLSYQPENFSSAFESRSSWLMQIAAGRLLSEKSFPGQAVSGEEIEYEVQLFLAEELDEDLVVRVFPKFPASFEMTEGSERFVLPEQAWELTNFTTQDDAPSNEDLIPTVRFNGRFTTDDDPEQTLVLEYHVQGPDGNFYVEKEEDFVTQIVQGEFLLSLILNGETTEKAVNLGEELNYRLTFKNQSASEARDVSISMEFPSGYMDYDTLITSPQGVRNGDTLTWTDEEINDLRSLDSGEGDAIDITVYLKDSLPEGVAVSSFTNQARALISSFSDVEANIEVKSNEIVSPINSDLNWTQSARYYSNDNIAIGSGPIPPKVGETTKLRIYWDLESSANAVTNLKVRGKLPANVEWTDKANTTEGEITYNDDTRTVTWQIDTLASGSRDVHGEFEVSIRPSFDDVNKIILLMPGPTLTGLDQVTEGEINLEGKAVTTDLDGDPVLSGKGLVES